MGLWSAYRRGQAGKYAKASYRLARWEAEHRVRPIVRVQVVAIALPPRPDRELQDPSR